MKWRNLIIMALVAVLLIGGYIFAVNYSPSQTGSDNPSAPSKESIVVFETESDSVTKIVFDNETPFALLKNGENWGIAGKSVNIEQSAAKMIAVSASYILASDEIGKAENLADYGFDKPTATLTVYHNNELEKFILGSSTPTGGYYYLMAEGKNAVYTVSSYTADLFFKSPSAVRDLTVTAFELTDILGFEINAPDETLKVDYASLGEGVENPYSTLSVWDISSPYYHDAENQKVVEKLVKPVSSIVAESIMEDGLSSTSKYNLNTTVTVKTPDKDYVLKVGEKDGKGYVYSKDKNIVYSVNPQNIAFAKVRADSIVQKTLVLPMLTDIQSVAVAVDNVSAMLSLKAESDTVTKYYIDGKFAEEKAFKSMYQKIMGLSLDGVIGKSVNTSNPVATIVYTKIDGSEEILQFYPYDDINVAVSKNSVVTFTMKKSKLTELQQALEKFIKNPTEEVK